jgi:hypothetical protein
MVVIYPHNTLSSGGARGESHVRSGRRHPEFYLRGLWIQPQPAIVATGISTRRCVLQPIYLLQLLFDRNPLLLNIFLY